MLNNHRRLKIFAIFFAMIMTIVTIVLIPVYGWLSRKELAVYAPITTNTSLFIGAGNGEDVRYLSFEGVDATSEQKYKDYVFTISGEFVRYYKIQIASTTNNQFEYELYRATTDSNETSDTTQNVVYRTNEETTPRDITYYIKTNGAIAGDFLNQDGTDLLGIKDTSDTYYHRTYGDYTNVNKYAVPMYWQTTYTINVTAGDSFPHYFILRVKTDNKNENDRETDIICIAARAQ